jgi:hypothetical protein
MDEETDDIPIHVDLSFQGLQNEFVNIKIPDKKPRGKELTEEHKQSNREKSSDCALRSAPWAIAYGGRSASSPCRAAPLEHRLRRVLRTSR